MAERKNRFLNVWDDTVSGRDLLLSLCISTPLTLGGYLLAPAQPPLPLILGLSGAILGFFINALLFRPKRQLQTGEET
ncbi:MULTISPECIES: hypothetical protein [Halomonas]|uniref:Uncharacterized protein n=1 Tax=Halomonas citrativorans TaxID=2742612 RepID=A0ABR9FF75_9GAMM|nr:MULTISPECIES: hypothetical protein [Halomonas]MBE0405123.1 hypothetical protein [Halomonas citrativorans]